MDDADRPDATPQDRSSSSRVLLVAGVALGVAGVAVFAAGGSKAQRVGLGLTSLGAGVALLSRMLRHVRKLREYRASPVWPYTPPWAKLLLLVRPIGIGIGVAMIIGFALFVFLTTYLTAFQGSP
jgi:hypothetical protein